MNLNPKVTRVVLIRLAGTVMILAGLAFVSLGLSAPGHNGRHDLSAGIGIGATLIVAGAGVVLLSKLAVLFFFLVCLAVGGRDLFGSYEQGAVTLSHLISVGILCLPATILLFFWKNLKWRGHFSGRPNS